MTKIKGPNGLVFDFPETLAKALLKDRAAYQPVDDATVLTKPVDKAPKNDWAAYAVQEGIDVTNMTKADIQAAVAALGDDEPEEPVTPPEDGGDGSGDDEDPEPTE